MAVNARVSREMRESWQVSWHLIHACRSLHGDQEDRGHYQDRASGHKALPDVSNLRWVGSEKTQL